MYDLDVVVQAVFLTGAIVVGLTLYTFNSKSDFTWLNSLLFSSITVMSLASLVHVSWNFLVTRHHKIIFIYRPILLAFHGKQLFAHDPNRFGRVHLLGVYYLRHAVNHEAPKRR